MRIGDGSEGTALKNLDALANVTTLGGLYLYGNDQLENIDGLSKVTSIAGDVRLGDATSSAYANDRLAHLDGLSGLTVIGGDFFISDNGALTDLNGLLALASVGGRLLVEANEALGACEGLAPLLGYERTEDGVAGTIKIGSNRVGCNSVQEILDSYSGQELTRPSYCAASSTIVLASQSEVDDFNETYGPCDTTPYGLTVDSNNITQVNGLSNLVTIKGDLKLYSSQLADISGLSNVTAIEGALRIGDGSEGTALKNLDALANVTTLGGLYLYGNDQLEDIDGLSKVTSVAGDIRIGNRAVPSWANDRLLQLDGLSGLKTVGGDLYIAYNSALADLNSLLALVSVGSGLAIIGNEALGACEGLAPLLGYERAADGVEGSIQIESNRAGCNSAEEVLDSYTGQELTRPGYCSAVGQLTLASQAEIAGFKAAYGQCEILLADLIVQGNEVTHLDGLAGLTEIRGSISLLAPKLTSVQGLSSLLTVDGDLAIGGLSESGAEGTLISDFSPLNALSHVGGALKIY
ncbi:MAG: hypothetical protein ACO3T7_14970, partial [Pseudomonadales bacterium]